MEILPQADFIHVKVKKTTSIGKIAIPDSVQFDEELITVVSVGPDVKLVKGGERILPKPMQGIRAILDGNETVFIRESDILAIVKED